MKLSIGIVGLPNVGKSTLFKLLTAQDIVIANYPFATIDPNVGIVSVPDERLETLTKLSNSKKTIPAVVEFYDIAGLVKGAYKGEGLGNQFLSHIKETQAIIMVLRVFKGEEIIHVEQSVDPVRDLDILQTEMAFKDLASIESALKRLEGEARAGNKEAKAVFENVKRLKETLEKSKPINTGEFDEILKDPKVRELNLLMGKKQLFLLNGTETDVTDALKKRISELGADYLVADLGTATSIPELTPKAYSTLNLISFFTTGEDETRAWTIAKGMKAPQAAGAIHTDFEKNFIRAEVVSYKDLVSAGDWNKAKQKGLMRVEGRDYVVQDGDVVVIRHG